MRQSQGAGWAATRVGYAEFSFGYAFTENLIRGSATALTGAPVFPTLVQEAILGYDVQIGFPAAPLFSQYKLPELMTRARASEMANGLGPGLTLDFFRIALMRRDVSDQHRLLIDWEGRFRVRSSMPRRVCATVRRLIPPTTRRALSAIPSCFRLTILGRCRTTRSIQSPTRPA